MWGFWVFLNMLILVICITELHSKFRGGSLVLMRILCEQMSSRKHLEVLMILNFR